MQSTLVTDLLAVLDKLSGGVHSGFRPVHAKGEMYSGTFTPSAGAVQLTRAPHAARPSTPITVRFSLSAGIPSVADNDPKVSSPQGLAVRFHLAGFVLNGIRFHFRFCDVCHGCHRQSSQEDPFELHVDSLPNDL